MKFTITSTDFLQAMLSALKVVPQRATMPVLTCFLLELKDNTLTITGSDEETTLKTTIALEGEVEEDRITVPASLLTEAFKVLPTQPVEFFTDSEKNIVTLKWANSGEASIPYTKPEGFPELPNLENPKTLQMPADVLLEGITNTLYACGDEQIRVVMNGILFDVTSAATTMVATNAQKLVYIRRSDIKGEEEGKFVLPKKPADVLKNALARFGDTPVTITYDSKNVYFKFEEQLVVCRLLEGTYPAYKDIIPTANPNVIVVARGEILNASKRIAVFANQATGQINFEIHPTDIKLTAQDVDLSMQAKEIVNCTYTGEPMTIGLKAQYLVEILAGLPYQQICFRLADPAKAILIQASEEATPEKEVCALLMPLNLR